MAKNEGSPSPKTQPSTGPGVVFSPRLIMFGVFLLGVLTCIITALVPDGNKSFESGLTGSNGTGYLPKPDYLYSASSIQKLAHEEKDIYAVVKDYSNKLQVQQRLLQRYMKDYEESSVNMMHNGKTSQEARDYAVVANPIIAHRIIRRFALEIPEIRDSVGRMDHSGFFTALDNANPDKMIYPTMAQDFNNSLYALLKIQRYSNLSTAEMSNGKLGNLQTRVGLQAKHALELGIYARKQNPPFLAHAIEWLEIGLDKVKEEQEGKGSSSSSTEDVILKELANVVEQHDKNCSVPTWNSGLEHCFASLIKDLWGDKRPKTERITLADRHNEWAIPFHKESKYTWDTKRNFLNTCSGREMQTQVERSRLSCWYETKKHPYTRISPFKIELLNEFPTLIQIYDMIPPQKRDTLVQIATPELTRSQVVNADGPIAGDVTDVRDARTSVHTWIFDDDSQNAELLDGLSRQIEYVTGLNVRNLREGMASEPYQVASYRTSHHYDEHLDAASGLSLMGERPTFEDDRLGTFMFYLTNVDEGGYTGFPTLGTAAKPEAGSAVFWYNQWRNGTWDMRTWHGGCPITHGIKWVATKWIRAYENFDKRLCSLNQFD